MKTNQWKFHQHQPPPFDAFDLSIDSDHDSQPRDGLLQTVTAVSWLDKATDMVQANNVQVMETDLNVNHEHQTVTEVREPPSVNEPATAMVTDRQLVVEVLHKTVTLPVAEPNNQMVMVQTAHNVRRPMVVNTLPNRKNQSNNNSKRISQLQFNKKKSNSKNALQTHLLIKSLKV